VQTKAPEHPTKKAQALNTTYSQVPWEQQRPRLRLRQRVASGPSGSSMPDHSTPLQGRCLTKEWVNQGGLQELHNHSQLNPLPATSTASTRIFRETHRKATNLPSERMLPRMTRVSRTRRSPREGREVLIDHEGKSTESFFQSSEGFVKI